MLFVPRAGQDFSKTTSYAVGARPSNTTFGTTVTPLTTAYGTPVTISPAPLTADSYGLYINFNSAFTGATPRGIAVEISVDYAGGTNWTTLFDGLLASEAWSYGLGGGLWYYFPIYIPAGASVGIAAWATNTTAFRANVIFMDRPSEPSMSKRAGFVETLGLTLGNATVTGVTVTPSTATTQPNTWTLIGTTVKRCWWWQFAVQQLGDTTMAANVYHLDLAVGNGTTFDTIILDSFRQVTTNESYNNIPDIIGVEKIVPAGSNIYARIHNAGANDGGTYQVVAYGCGG